MISLERWPKVKALREKLNGKAKAEPAFRFYTLYDKMYRNDVLEAAYAQVRANGGAPGVDGANFANIESYGVNRYLAELAVELKARGYRPQPVRRVLIPKVGKPGQFRPLGIPTIRDRIVQQAVKLLLEPIFEADFTENAYGYRAGKSAHEALLAVDAELRSNHSDVVDADLSKYFDTIPHSDLMRSVERRVADRKVLWLIRVWLKVPVHEVNARGKTVISGGKKTKCGTPQGGVVSPLLANIYFRRFLLAWKKFGLDQKYQSRIVNYADDFVILTRGHAREALQAARQILQGMGLTLNEEKTRACRAWNQSFDFLGYTFGKLYTRDGKPYLGFQPSDKSVQRYRDKVRQLTAKSQTLIEVEEIAKALNQVTRGFWNYFSIGTTAKLRSALDRYLFARMVCWAKRKYPRPRPRKGRTLGLKARYAKFVAAVDQLSFGREVRRHWTVARAE
ncbi:MAG: group II intron reverse transcriptase/maturase [Planctomycetes bacterium]|nr:group II intron reverse transcriptase/maturase [Planctomycetota bacterium]